MKLDQNIANLVCELEPTIAWKCYNPNSYNGWSGEYGCSFRYPVWYKDFKHSSPLSDVSPDEIKELHYKFGSNILSIGEGLLGILRVLERRYGLDINALEDAYQQKLAEECQEEAADDAFAESIASLLEETWYIDSRSYPKLILMNDDNVATYVRLERKACIIDRAALLKIQEELADYEVAQTWVITQGAYSSDALLYAREHKIKLFLYHEGELISQQYRNYTSVNKK